MRAGGITGLADSCDVADGVRIQTLLRAEEVAFPAEEVEEVLSRMCQRRHGWNDDKHLETSLSVLRKTRVLLELAKQGNDDANRLHKQLRDTLTWPTDPDDAELLGALTRRRIPHPRGPGMAATG